jgi:hypothetical protein
MTQITHAPQDEMTLPMTLPVPPQAKPDGHKISRPTQLKDREEALRANLLKRKHQKQTRNGNDS